MISGKSQQKLTALLKDFKKTREFSKQSVDTVRLYLLSLSFYPAF